MEELEGTIENVIFSGGPEDYSVVRLRTSGAPVTAVGSLASPVTGEKLKLKGRWTNHPRFGRQFAIQEYEAYPPSTKEGIERYLSSGLVPGIGSKMASRIVTAFGDETLEILDHNPERLAEVEGLGKKRIEAIGSAWGRQRGIRRVMVFLQSHGAGTAMAAKIYKRYGDHAVAVVQENPYRLSIDVTGIGFLTADRIARSVGIEPDSPSRAEAGVLHALNESAAEGNVCYPRIRLIQRCQKLLQIDREIIAEAVDSLSAAGHIVADESPSQSEPRLYLPAFYRAEVGIATMLSDLKNQPAARPLVEMADAMNLVKRDMEITLADKQLEALRAACESKVMIITGGPGTGKTTIIRSLLVILNRSGAKVMLAAPTGRAAKRMQEATGKEAKTIHRLLQFDPKGGSFQRNSDSPLECEWLILDEASMIDTILMYHLLKALPNRCSLVLVGDSDQLPSVGPGRVLQDIIQSGSVPVVELNEIFRQDEAGQIVINAHRINLGLMPQQREDKEGDFYFIQREDPDEAARLILRLCRDRIPGRFHLDPITDIQVLSPMHRGPSGVTNLNRMLQNALNPGGSVLIHGDQHLKRGDKIMQIRNNYEKEVYNGDIGRIEMVEVEAGSITVGFDDRHVRYEGSELDELALAYAVSVHKAQGSEFPAVVVPVLMQHYPLLQRNLIYTAVTRGKQLVVIVGTHKALALALKKTETGDRYTGLRRRLADRAARTPGS